MFRVNDEYLEIEQAYIDGQLDDEEEKVLILGLGISAKMLDDHTLPLVSSETLLKIRKGEIRKVQDIGGKILEWEKCSKNIWKPHLKFVNLYKKSARESFVYNARIVFESRKDNVFVKISGLCDSKYNGKEIKTLSLNIETEVEFSSIAMGPHETEEKARERLKPYLDHEDFCYRVSKLDLNNLKSTDTGIDMGKFDFKK